MYILNYMCRTTTVASDVSGAYERPPGETPRPPTRSDTNTTLRKDSLIDAGKIINTCHDNDNWMTMTMTMISTSLNTIGYMFLKKKTVVYSIIQAFA